MRRALTTTAAIAALLVLTTSVALAAVVFHSGPTITDNNDGTYTITADMSGLGNQPATATFEINQTVFYTCQNKGGNVAPGQNGVPISSSDTQQLSTTKNGRAVLNLTVEEPEPEPTVSGKTAGCPNGNWTGINPVVVGGTTGTLTIVQGGDVIFQETYTL